MRGLIVTVDDFGAAVAVNEAVERGCSEGIVTAASLMVGGEACTDAVERARRLPGLGVGLHIVLADGRPVLPPERIPALVGSDGRFRDSMLRTALAIACSPAARAQMQAEVEAQFAAFAETGLRLDHVNAHKHFHLHPMIASAIMAIGPRYGMRAVRVPHERATLWALRWWARLLAGRLRRAGLLVNDEVRGLRWSGAFDAARMEQALVSLPDGLTELYCHAASADSYPGSAAGYRYRDELAALLDPAVRAALASSVARHGCFGDFPFRAS
ncbi:hopanoid biosynthesis-associated protein HpnK [Novosphingobium sp. G106]|uniref:hopanoid biosynthesis-associated protein HpnK n=1 Tax=Novosphingobium sp. G106 TaxID=2849500 RepID=UPI001C2DC427|nr:hopanoid biosynthesis-associated protein HpnK [Novosphingobium sp. G106]MBV1688645.1 hopanoid biosynthesis-associated protein HpnK [Novosphingobium sp. G106]